MEHRTEEELVQAFHLMWDNYPEQVRLIRRDYQVVAGNPAYLRMGGQVGGKCNVGPAEFHKGCRAREALDAGETKTVRHEVGDFVSFWVPVKGEDYYIHFTNGAEEAFRKMMEQNAQQS